jgi:predicted AlkP superfamily pyrophosphatase or phosphodiesterase
VRKAVLLIIDGLRWDIAAGHAASAVAGRNLSLPSLRTLTTSHAAAALLPFIADPPTTTQQRLKGLLTGAQPRSGVALAAWAPHLSSLANPVQTALQVVSRRSWTSAAPSARRRCARTTWWRRCARRGGAWRC